RLILQSSEKAKDLTQKILTYARGKEKTRERISLEKVVRECLEESKPALPDRIRLHLEFEGPGQVYADRSEMYQIIQNLISNGVQAMENREGDLTVRIKPFWVSNSPGENLRGLSAGLYQLLEIEDSGIGIPRESFDKLFDPYYSTKELGTGTGLGLALVQSIVEEEEGIIQVESRYGEGSLFRVYLPAAAETKKSAKASILGEG
ncbi:MAG: HAMP domain-containing sensor histidine kinase, partial [Spirochaetales bacterium]|nr:HAMP domain-containing sensor histidine kinase [Spirochaetales bacterium]